MAQRVVVSVPAEGSAGQAAGAVTVDIFKPLIHVHIAYADEAPVTTDVALDVVLSDGSTVGILRIEDNNTSRFLSPVTPAHDEDGEETTAHLPVTPAGPLRISVEDCDALESAVLVTLFVEG